MRLTSTNLPAAMNPCQRLKTQIQRIKASGKVAPEKTWISSYNVPKKSGKRYTYYRLMGVHPSLKGAKLLCYLGSEDNQEYKEMKKAIARRNQIQKLERQLARLKQLEQLQSAQVSGDTKSKASPLTSAERTILLQLPTQLNQVVKELASLKAQIETFGKAYALLGVK